MLTPKLKIRALWICEGEANTKYFNSFSSVRRNSKTIWDLYDNDGKLITTDATLKQLGEQHFANLFKDDGKTNIVDQLKVIGLFPSYVQETKKDCFLTPTTISEVEANLKVLKKYKIPSLDC